MSKTVKILKDGDRVRITSTSDYYGPGDISNPMHREGTIRTTKRSAGFGMPIIVDWDNKEWNTYDEQDLELVKQKQNKTINIMQLMKDAVEKAANKLLQANNTVTTLEVKNELRKSDPHFRWKQNADGTVPGVSELMNELYDDGKFVYYDNGTYRVYSSAKMVAKTLASLPTGTTTATSSVVKAPKAMKPKTLDVTGAKKISMKKALELIQDTKGRFFTVLFVKQDGSERVMNAQYLKDQTNSVLGYVKVRDAAKMKSTPKDAIRQINLQTLKVLKVGGATYKVK